MVAAWWSVDRLGRSIDLLDFLRELHAKGVDLFPHQQGLDTSTPSGRAMFQMLGVFAEFERSMIRERVMAGLSSGPRRMVFSSAAGGWRIATRTRWLRSWRPMPRGPGFASLACSNASSFGGHG
jgi:Resolvase, N terminal domain